MHADKPCHVRREDEKAFYTLWASKPVNLFCLSSSFNIKNGRPYSSKANVPKDDMLTWSYRSLITQNFISKQPINDDTKANIHVQHHIES